jgi:hypothetical protein
MERALGREMCRQLVLDRCATAFPFPLHVSFRGVVVGRRHHQGRDHIVVSPVALTGEALRVLGGVLVPTARNLFPGAVVDVRCNLADPDEYALDEGLLAEIGEIDVVVPVEP